MQTEETQQKAKSRKEEWKIMFKFFKTFKPNWKLVVGGILMILLISLLQLPGPFLSQYLIDKSLPTGDRNTVILIGILILVLLSSRSLLTVLNHYVLAKFREGYLLEINSAYFKHILAMPLSFFKSYDSNYLLTRILNDTNETEGVFADNMLALVSNLVTFSVGICALFYIHWKLALASVLMLPFFITSGRIVGNKVRNHAAVIQENAARIGQSMGRSLLGAFMIKTFARENYIEEKVSKLLKKKEKDSMKMSVLNSLNSNIGTFIGGFGSLVVLCFGILEIINGHLTLGKLVAFNGFLAYLYSPLSGLIGVNARFQRSISGMNRIFQMIDIPTEFSCEEQTLDIRTPLLKGNIRFEGVSFSYEGDREVLKDINISINAGELLAIVGRSGAGKTTLVNLLPRLYEPDKGVIRLDGVNLQDIPKKQLREILGFVSQETFLFEGSIMDNIRFANPSASDEEIEAAIHATGIDVFLQRLSLDMKTDVGVLGTKLSGGQKQLIAIARALVKKPRILILDEATAHMDFETEHLLKGAIGNAVKNKTTIMIAHRLTTVLNADRIMAMDNGQIVGLGTHQHLYQENPFYKEIFDRQFLDNSN